MLVLLATSSWGNHSDGWDNASLKAAIVKKWGQLARRLKSYPALQACDLTNEPVLPQTLLTRSAQARWHRLAEAIASELSG